MFVAAILYAAVGHGGASAYIAAMALAGIAPAEMRPIALQLNLLVSALAAWKFWRAGHFRWPLFWPDRKSTRLNSSHSQQSRMPSSA